MGAQTSDPAVAAATPITVNPQSAQKVTIGTPDHFTGLARVQSLFDAKAPSHNTGRHGDLPARRTVGGGTPILLGKY